MRKIRGKSCYQVGLDDGLKAEIISGLSEGETVIVEIKTKSAASSLF
jgi:hypothetical protein